MADLLPRRVNALTASARVLTATREDEPKSQGWHDEAWEYRNTTGEVRYAEMWLANSLSRVRLVAAKRPTQPGGQPEPVTTGPAADLVARLAGGVAGQAALNRAFAVHLLTPGIGYLVGEPGSAGAERWGVYSSDQLRLSPQAKAETGERLYELQEGEDTTRDWRLLSQDSLIVKVWRPHPRWSWMPDSPVRGALPVLRELQLLTQHVEASATSRLAGAGIIAFDSQLEFPNGWDEWIKEFLAAITKPIKNRSSAAAYAPFPVRIPGPVKDKIMHLMFNTPFDEHALKLREEAIARLATAMDMPKAALTGEQENHWGKWATTEEGITLHVMPNMELICDGLTTGFLAPGLATAAGRASGEVVTRTDEERVRVTEQEPPPGSEQSEFIVWYDASDLQVRPDRSADTVLAYDRWQASGDDLRRETGISDAAVPDTAEFERRVWVEMLSGEMAPLALQKLGLATPDEIKATRPAQPPQLQPGPPEDEVPAEEQGLPDTEDDDEPSEDDVPVAAAAISWHPGLALLAACDGLVHRALEKAGNRLRNATRRERAMGKLADAKPHLMHTVCNAARFRPLDVLLEDAWDRVPDVAGNLVCDPAALRNSLDLYTRTLIRTNTPHSWDALSDHLAADEVAAPPLPAVRRVG